MRGEFVDLDGNRLYCYAAGTRGEGEPIVLVHGAFTSSHIWRDVVARLPKGHRVLVLDLLGHGRSDLPAGAGYAAAAHADRLHTLLDVLGVEPCCLVGHGFGAAVVAELARREPQRATRLLLCNPCLLAAGDESGRAPGGLRRLARAAPLWRHLPPALLASALHTALSRGYTNRAFAGHVLDVYLRPYRTEPGRAAALQQLAAIADAEACVSLPARALPMPVSVMLGEDDPFVPAGGEPLQAALATVATRPLTVHRLAGLAHAIPEEAPDRVAIAVAELLVP
jgi:pimeloyl-ACP methyl ester carboxylesterase